MKLKPQQFAAALYEITQGKSEKEIDKIIEDFTALLAKKNKLGWQEQIIEKFLSYSMKQEGIMETQVFTAKEISKKMAEKIAETVFKNQKIKVISIVEKELLGGFVVKTEDKILDLSIKKQLQNLKIKLIE